MVALFYCASVKIIFVCIVAFLFCFLLCLLCSSLPAFIFLLINIVAIMQSADSQRISRMFTPFIEAIRTVECGLHLYLYYRFRKSFLYLTPKNSASSCISLSFIVLILGICAVSIYICAAFSTVSIRPKVSSIVLPAP